MKFKSLIVNAGMIVAVAVVALVIGTKLPGLIKTFRDSSRNSDYSEHVSALPYKLTLYGTTTCPHCAAARDYLKKAGIPFNDQIVDQSKSADAAYRKLGEKYVPVLVSAHKAIVGFDKAAYGDLAHSVYEK